MGVTQGGRLRNYCSMGGCEGNSWANDGKRVLSRLVRVSNDRSIHCRVRPADTDCKMDGGRWQTNGTIPSLSLGVVLFSASCLAEWAKQDLSVDKTVWLAGV